MHSLIQRPCGLDIPCRHQCGSWMEERRPDAQAQIRDVLARHVLKKKLTQYPRLRSGGLGAASRHGLFDSAKTTFSNQVPLFIKVCLGVPLQLKGTFIDIEGYAD